MLSKIDVNVAPSFFSSTYSFFPEEITNCLKNIQKAKIQLAANVNSVVTLQVLLLSLPNKN